jgi:hypothetical protein
MSENNIHDMHSLEKEIYRLRLKQKDQEAGIRRNVNRLKPGRWMLGKLEENLSGKISDRLGKILDRLFPGNK